MTSIVMNDMYLVRMSATKCINPLTVMCIMCVEHLQHVNAVTTHTCDAGTQGEKPQDGCYTPASGPRAHGALISRACTCAQPRDGMVSN